MHRSRAMGLVAMGLALAACQPPQLTAQGGGMVQPRVSAAAPRVAPRVTLAGVAVAPAGIVANAGAGVIANAGASVIANAGASVIANAGASVASGSRPTGLAPRFALLAAEALVPAADAEVVLLAADGRPFPGVAPTRTDALGRFALAGVPAGQTNMVEIRGKGFRLGRLVRPAADGAKPAEVRVDPASTAVADGVRAALPDPKSLEHVPAERIATLEAAMKEAADRGEVAIDLTPGGSAAEALAKVEAKRPEAAAARQAAVKEAKEAQDEAHAAQPATPAEPGQAPAVPATPADPGHAPAQPANPAGPGGDRPAGGPPSQAPAAPPSHAPGGQPAEQPGGPPSHTPGGPPADQPDGPPSHTPGGPPSNAPGGPPATTPGGPPSSAPGNGPPDPGASAKPPRGGKP